MAVAAEAHAKPRFRWRSFVAGQRLGTAAHEVTWLEADALSAELPPGHFDVCKIEQSLAF